jgi:Na+-transporting methylmalonyl-CoA/oxaloacetate decarboxylase gamma subunit
MLRVPRSRGALNGVLLVLLGIWGGLIAFVGPYFHYAYTPDKAWTYTTGRLWLEILPAAAAVVGGLIVSSTASRPVAIFGAWLAALSGAWFAIGTAVSTLWTAGGAVAAGSPVGGTLSRAVEQIGFFTGLGVVIVFLAAVALGRFTVIGMRERTVPRERPAPEATQPAPAHARVPEASTPGDDVTATRVAGTSTRGTGA